MPTLDSRLLRLAGHIPKSYWDEKIAGRPGYWAERIISQLLYARELSKVAGDRYDTVVERAVEQVERVLAQEGAITRTLALEAEEMLADLAQAAKSYRVLCVAHAHIDMNWKWPWQETVSVTLDTFQTMLKLLDEYPDFRFSQSQGAIYRIVEQYDPHMLEQIKRRVAEGRWEVTASHWVEADKNMPNGESLVRQILYSKRYLSHLFGLDPDRLPLDFEPDTFGHSMQVPEILAGAGIRHYYHCRGSEGPLLYRWEAPSGRSVIAYREPTWYNDFVQPILGAYVPDICRRTGLSTHLYVYGVGDHGGGPTRRDLERLLDMQQWPIYPTLAFGTYGEFFALAETQVERLPVVHGEQNFVFTGCYTSQSRIKQANRAAENALYEAEAYRSLAAVFTGLPYPTASLEQAWRRTLFNQFHDILPGSGVPETREHALGSFQETMAIAGASKKQALEALVQAIDTSGLGLLDPLGIAEGAGAGFRDPRTGVSQVERGSGASRIVHVFNPSLEDREEVVAWTLWDWKSPGRTFLIREASTIHATEQSVPNQVLDQAFHHYWGHDYMRILFRARVPALGYSTYVLTEDEHAYVPIVPDDLRVEHATDYILENEEIRAVFDPHSAKVISLIHKRSGEEMIDPDRPGGAFHLITEQADEEMTAWLVGACMQVEDAHLICKWLPAVRGELRHTLRYELFVGSSRLAVEVSLDQGGTGLIYEMDCDWRELGQKGVGVPQLRFAWPLAYEAAEYRYDVPFGTLTRPALPHEVPASSWVRAGRPQPEQPAVQLVAEAKHGFRAEDNSLHVSLLRSTIDPDPYPEFGIHRFRLAVLFSTQDSDAAHPIRQGKHFMQPLSVVSGTPKHGTAPVCSMGLALAAGSVSCSAIKMPEAGETKDWIVRLYETDGDRTEVCLKLARPVKGAYFVDALERVLETAEKIALEPDGVRFAMEAHSIAAIRLSF